MVERGRKPARMPRATFDDLCDQAKAHADASFADRAARTASVDAWYSLAEDKLEELVQAWLLANSQAGRGPP